MKKQILYLANQKGPFSETAFFVILGDGYRGENRNVQNLGNR